MRMNAYFAMSTANPTGQRPWNFAMQPRNLGRLSGPRRLGKLRGLGRMGDGFLPGGSLLSYTATWPKVSTTGNVVGGGLFGGPSSVLSGIQGQLSAQWGIQVLSEWDNSGFVSSTGFSLQLQTTRDYGTAADVKSILDSLVGAQVGAPGMIGAGYGSTIAITPQVVSPPLSTGASTDPNQLLDPNQPVDLGTWLTQNWMTVAIVFVAVSAVPAIIKKL